MKRKVNRVGQNTLTVSLPSKWTKFHGIKSGDEINLLEKGNSLVIHTEKSLSGSIFESDVSGLSSQLIERVLLSAYKSGYDEIKLTYKKDSVHDLKKKKEISMSSIISDNSDLLIGMEVVSQSKTGISLKQITEISDKEFENILRRVYLLLLEESDLLSMLLFDSKNKVSDENCVQFRTIRKLNLYCLRVLNKKSLSEGHKMTLYHNLIAYLDEINSTYKWMFTENKHTRFDGECKELYGFVHKTMRRLYELNNKFTLSDADEILVLRRHFFEKINSAPAKKVPQVIFSSRLTMVMLNCLYILELMISINQ